MQANEILWQNPRSHLAPNQIAGAENHYSFLSGMSDIDVGALINLTIPTIPMTADFGRYVRTASVSSLSSGALPGSASRC